MSTRQPRSFQNAVNESGYPLQLKLEDLINEKSMEHNWYVLVKEHHWLNSSTGDEGFIDLILGSHSLPKTKLVIECKKYSDNWIFLIPNKNPSATRESKIFAGFYENSLIVNDWRKTLIRPETYESSFCVSATKDSRTLEKISGELLLSLESLAIEESKLTMDHGNGILSALFYLPIIITTAKLYICLFDPGNINLDNGEISESEIKPVNFIRFNKNLATSLKDHKSNKDYYSKDSLVRTNLENDRTVFIVQSESILGFLKEFFWNNL